MDNQSTSDCFKKKDGFYKKQKESHNNLKNLVNLEKGISL